MKKVSIYRVLNFIILGFVFQNCADMDANFDLTSQSSSASNSFTTQQPSTKQACRFIGREALSSLLINVLDQPSGDVDMVNETGAPLRSNNCKSFNHAEGGGECKYLEQYSSELSTNLCNASTFRLVSQIFINACSISLGQPETVNRLFPRGSEDFQQIYLAFTGRSLTNDESEILTQLTNEFENDEEKNRAVCAAIGSSLASINSF